VPLRALAREAARASLQAVQIGDRNREQAQVLGGLQVGETVIVFPSDLVVDGVEINDTEN
jgi:HlyD family secretion protein